MAPWIPAVWLALLSAPAPSAIGLEDVRRGLRDSAAALDNFSCSFHCDRSMRRAPDSDEVFSLYEDATVVAEARGRGRYEGKRSGVNFSAGGKANIYEAMALGAFDGKAMRSMDGVGKYGAGKIAGNRHELPWQMDPWNYVNRYFNEPVHELLEKMGADLAGTTTWQGRPVWTVETRPVPRVGEKESLGKYRFLVDVERGFTIVEKAALVKLGAALDWAVYSRISGYDHVEIKPGIWMPMRLEHESLLVKKEEMEKGIAPKTAWRWNIQVHEWKVNQPLADSLFDVSFPPGLFVNDQIQGRSYHVAAITDQTVADHVAMTAPVGAARGRWSRVLAGVAVILGLLALLVIAARWRARRERRAAQ